MWKVVYIAPTEEATQRIKKLLEENGFLVQLKTSGGRHNKAFEICVPFSETEDACEVLREHNFQGI